MGQKVDLLKSHTPYDYYSQISPVVDDIFIHDSNILKNSVNSPEILKKTFYQMSSMKVSQKIKLLNSKKQKETFWI